MQTDHESCFAVDYEPEIVLDSGNFNYGFIGVPLVGIDIRQGQERNTHIIKQGCESGAPVADGNMRNRDGEGCAQDETDVAKGIFARIKHRERGDRRVLPDEERVVVALVAAAIVAVMRVVVMREGPFPHTGQAE